ncbi:MAG: type II toxin-antitoxin system VapC family toxin [Gemmatimonadota bacterium]
MLLLDSNIYIAAFNDSAFGRSFREFHRAQLPQLLLSAVVAHELLVGARTPRKLRDLTRGLLEPFRTRRRLHTPGYSTWQLAAGIDRRLRISGKYAASLAQRSFANDLLIAATARELGATIVTSNLSDFRLIADVVPIKFVAPWPS